MGHRRAEERDDGVADELLDGAAEALKLQAEALVVRSEQLADVLRVHLLGPRGESDEIGEEHGHDLALFARRRRLQFGAAGEAELRDVRVLLAAIRADHAPKRMTCSARRRNSP